LKGLSQKFIVALSAIFVLVQTDVFDIHLTLELKESLDILDPNGARRRIDPVEGLLQKILEELSRRRITSGEASHLFEGLVNLS
jgi:hypothetical protein